MAEPLTREAFERSRSAAAVVARRDRLMLAALRVGAGVLQLIFLRWADVHLERASRLAIALPVFVIYILVVASCRGGWSAGGVLPVPSAHNAASG